MPWAWQQLHNTNVLTSMDGLLVYIRHIQYQVYACNTVTGVVFA